MVTRRVHAMTWAGTAVVITTLTGRAGMGAVFSFVVVVVAVCWVLDSAERTERLVRLVKALRTLPPIRMVVEPDDGRARRFPR